MTLQVGDIVENGLAIGEIVEQNGELYFQYAIYDHQPTDGIDPLSELYVADMAVIGHVGTDSELLEIDNTDYNDVW